MPRTPKVPAGVPRLGNSLSLDKVTNMPQVISTLTDSVLYAAYDRSNPDSPTISRAIHVAGGAGLPSARSGFGDFSEDVTSAPMWTPAGVVTIITDDQAEFLEAHPLFQIHKQNGFVKIIQHDVDGNHRDIKEVVADMEQGDKASLLDDKKTKTIGKVTAGGPSSEAENAHRI